MVQRIRTATHRTRARCGVTLVELLVVVAVIGILIAITVPAVQATRDAARKTLCSNNLRQVGLAISQFESAHQSFPPGQVWVSRTAAYDFSDWWAAQILGFLEQQDLRDGLNFKKPYLDGDNLQIASQAIPCYLCPATALCESHRNAEDKLFGIETGAGNGLALHRLPGNLRTVERLGQSGHGPGVRPATRNPDWHQRSRNELTLKRPPAVRGKHVIDGFSKTACVTECGGPRLGFRWLFSRRLGVRQKRESYFATDQCHQTAQSMAQGRIYAATFRALL